MENINSEKYKNLNYDKKNIQTKSNIEKSKNNIFEGNHSDSKKEKDNCIIFDETIAQSKKKANPYRIIEFSKIIGKHQMPVDFIEELENGFFVSDGSDNSLILYNQFFEKIKTIECNDWVYKDGEKMNYKEKSEDSIKLLCAINQEFQIINLDKKDLKINKNKYKCPNKTFTNFVEIKENNIVSTGRGGASYCDDFFNEKKRFTEIIITEKTYRGLIKVNDKNASLSSNKIILDGEDCLLLYNTKKKTEPLKISGYSPNPSINNFVIMPREENKINYKILLCACTKFTKDQKNGILLINPQLGDNKNIENPFYETENFEVYCFCPILQVINKNSNSEKENIDEEYRRNITRKDTDYFFVGGYDLDQREGKIKLFKIIYGSKAWETKIVFIQDIIVCDDDKFENFDGAITCIKQSKISGCILVTCYNRNVYLFTPPNMDLFINNKI